MEGSFPRCKHTGHSMSGFESSTRNSPDSCGSTQFNLSRRPTAPGALLGGYLVFTYLLPVLSPAPTVLIPGVAWTWLASISSAGLALHDICHTQLHINTYTMDRRKQIDAEP
eukprot:scaffold3410_cov398-Prasinococcus_capsulatus_cf.AAC.5